MAGASDDRYGDPVLRQLAELSVRLAGTNGLLLHATYVQYIGALADGTLLLQVDDGADSDPEDDPIPPWPAAGEEDPLEEPFGRDADEIRRVTLEDVKKLERGDHVAGSTPRPDLTKPGAIGTGFDSADQAAWVSRALHDSPDSGRVRTPAVRALPGCGKFWLLTVLYYEHTVACAGYNYGRAYRATLLRAFAEAYRLCRKRDPACPNARLWMVSGAWSCDSEGPKPKGNVTLEFAVQCTAS